VRGRSARANSTCCCPKRRHSNGTREHSDQSDRSSSQTRRPGPDARAAPFEFESALVAPIGLDRLAFPLSFLLHQHGRRPCASCRHTVPISIIHRAHEMFLNSKMQPSQRTNQLVVVQRAHAGVGCRWRCVARSSLLIQDGQFIAVHRSPPRAHDDQPPAAVIQLSAAVDGLLRSRMEAKYMLELKK